METTTNGTKYTFVCDPDECDTLIEVTCVSGFDFPNGIIKHTCPCGRQMAYISATILTSNQPTKEEKMQTTMEAQTMTLAWQNNGIDETTTYTENDVRSAMYNNRRYAEKQNEWFKKESELRTLLEEVYAESQEQETLSAIAEIFDVPLTKEVEYTAWVRVDLTVEVELGGDLDAIQDFIAQNLTVDSYDSLIQVNNHEVDRIEEGEY